MRSARSASRVLVEEVESEESVWWWLGRVCGWAVPWWPSFMAVVEKPEFGVPLVV
jgi:hypothetical protein